MECILHSFWTWLGTLILVYAVMDGVKIVVDILGSRRKVKVSQHGDYIIVEIENASEHDIRTALADVSRNADVIQNGEEHDSYD